MPSTTTHPTQHSIEKRRAQWVPYAVGAALLPLVYLLLIDKVGSSPIPVWDEGRLAVNAAEMEQHGNWLVTFFDGKPDMWNTKPPLMIWLEVLSLRLFGYSETALRLPAMLASVCTAGVIYAFIYRRLESLWGAVLAVLVMTTTIGYNDIHGARTGDYDVLLTLWLTIGALNFFRYIEEGNRANFIWTAVAFTLAGLTKGVAGLFWLPALVIYAATQRRLLWLLRRPEVYIGAACVLLVLASYYMAREHYNPGYWQAVFENELGGRLLTTLEGHLHPWSFYLENMYNEKFMPWLLIFPVSFLFVWRRAALLTQRHFAVFAALVVVLHIAIISSASTKLLWYDTPIYPMAAMLLGLSMGLLVESIVAWQYEQGGKLAAGFAGALFVLIVFTTPVLQMYNKIYDIYLSRHNDPFLAHGFQVRAMAEQLPQANKYTLYTIQPYQASMIFYKMAAQKNYGHTVDTKFGPQEVNGFKSGDVIVVCGDEDKGAVEEKFETMTLLVSGPCSTLLLQKHR